MGGDVSTAVGRVECVVIYCSRITCLTEPKSQDDRYFVYSVKNDLGCSNDLGQLERSKEGALELSNCSGIFPAHGIICVRYNRVFPAQHFSFPFRVGIRIRSPLAPLAHYNIQWSIPVVNSCIYYNRSRIPPQDMGKEQ